MLQALEIPYPSKDDQLPVDLCLATNMISVGVDVARLGLMTVIGQPKTTSEYIQATSRVGRSSRGPGLVVVIYNTGKPRDRSLYERFHSYHQAIYSQVEPTSITPFSIPVNERALHALLVTYIRYFGSEDNSKHPRPFPETRLFEKFKSLLHDRVKNIDPDELERTIKLLNARIKEWNEYLPGIYGNFEPPKEFPLMYPAGSDIKSSWAKKSWSTQGSMRSVDVNCVVKPIERYLSKENE
jgi:hypothetical protein